MAVSGTYPRKYHVRAGVQSAVFLCLVLGGWLAHRFVPATEELHRRLSEYNDGNSTAAAPRLNQPEAFRLRTWELNFGVKTARLDMDNTTPNVLHRRASECNDNIQTADPPWLLVFYSMGVIYMFIAIAIACDEFFVPALEEMSSERHLHLSTDVAGATLMAAGGSAPEFFSNFFGTFTDSAIGFGTIVGSAVFNVLFVIAMCALLAKEVLNLTWWPLFRDSAYYAMGLSVLAVFVGATSKGKIVLWEAIVLFVLYMGYIVLMYYNKRIYKRLTGKELIYRGEEETEAEPQEAAQQDGEVSLPERGLGPHRTGISQLSMMSGSSLISLTQDHGVHVHPPGLRFRAGILKLLRDPDSWVDTAGVGVVAKIAGDADQIFHCVDLNNDGIIDREELEQLFEKLGCHMSAQELDAVFSTLDENKDGEISAREFANWYVRSEELILSRVKEVFDRFDSNHSGTIDRDKVKMLLETLEPRVTDEDVGAAIDAMYQSGSHEEITFDEFSDWYRESLIYQRQKKDAEEDMEGVWENLKPPSGGSWLAWSKYLLVLPLVIVMTFTIPDTQRPGMSKWCYVSFIMSIAWIGGFSYFMVSWTEIIGHTIGIPSVVMGYTLLAAGTSVPDLLSSVFVARQGYGDMAVSSSIGSNIFDILVGLPVPWIIYLLWPSKPDSIRIGSRNILVSVLVLLGMLVFVIAAVHCQGWKLTNTLAGLMMVFYFAFLVQAILLELPFDSCI